MWALSELVILGAAFIGTVIIVSQRGWAEGVQCCGLDVPEAVQAPDKLLARWDAGYYGLIAAQGYRPDGPERAFFPLFPLLSRLVAIGMGGDVYRAGTAVSAVAALIAGLSLYQLVRSFASHRQALLAVACFYTFPTAFYLFAPYAEGLLLAAGISALWLARRGAVVRSGMLIGIASLARPTGWLLLLPLAIDGFVRYRHDPSGLARLGLGIGLGSLGTIGALALMHLGESPYVWSTYAQVNQQFWDVQFVWPWTTVAGAVGAALFGQGLGADWFTRASAIAELLSGVFVVGALVVLVIRRAPVSLSVIIVATLLILATEYGPGGHALDSMPRHVLSVFPVFAAVALLLSGRTAAILGWLCTSELLLIVATAWFASGRWVS
jgi:Gpi18-like mannosyltransferase